MQNVAHRPAVLLSMLLVIAGLLAACTGDEGRDDSPLQSDQSVTDPTATPTEAETVESDADATVETTVVTSVIGDTVTITGVVARYLSDEVITLEGVVLEAQPAEELLVIIPETLEPQGGMLDEGALVAVEGVIFQVTNERLADIDRSIFDEHGELLEGFRSAWGIAATDVRAAEDGE